ncbi:hypothetical protein IEZ26_09500 [Nocardioides cavernae]|uniref:Endonuclease/exonuclease/phosphatase domain-containing protein n=1 Tax=Nocardioides cavernae TaxID=1921566 RepID=A0ABR8N9N0_9ACTN|nr:hypothetical protein [Nocardioides cavernae]MBD3924851.1 hypothetical protein [Nocardioides cavernae]MBM7514775.1 hypothetical protein [Nocardioides cavernae]
MFLLPVPPRVLARPTAALVAVLLLFTGLAVAGSPAQARQQERTPAAFASGAKFGVATLNLKKGMRVAGMRHDIAQVLDGDASVIGFQERLFSRPALRAALPKSWTLLMPKGPTGTDDNPIAFDKKVWEVEKTWAPLLTGTTWRRYSGRIAHDQYGVAAVLRHRKTGHTIRAVSFHLPNHLHNRRSGGPNYANRRGVEAMWRMASRIRSIKEDTPDAHQFVAMCDCNVTANRDTGDHLVKGRITKPLRLETNYSADKHRRGSGIDYVMGERDSDFRIHSFHSYRHLVTDHPGVVATFERVR